MYGVDKQHWLKELHITTSLESSFHNPHMPIPFTHLHLPALLL